MSIFYLLSAGQQQQQQELSSLFLPLPFCLSGSLTNGYFVPPTQSSLRSLALLASLSLPLLLLLLQGDN